MVDPVTEPEFLRPAASPPHVPRSPAPDGLTAAKRLTQNGAPGPALPGTRWYAVQCQPHRERMAEGNLAKQGYSTFLPQLKKTRRHARKIETVLVPFFPGYLFVELDMARHMWRSVNGTFGVARLVMQGDRPAPAPVGVVEALMTACGPGGLLNWHAHLVPGQTVRVLNGPFTGLIGELESMTDSGRVRVLLDILGGATPVHFPRDYVVPANSSV